MPEARTPVRVLVVDDQPIFLRTASSLIDATPGFEQVAAASSGPEALELAANSAPDLMLVDVRMPRMDGIETARRLTAAHPEAMVVLISLEEVPELSSAVGAARAAGYVRKQDLSTRTLRDLWRDHAVPA
jgi:two-component system, NarL family, invasion response regulator UvrY